MRPAHVVFRARLGPVARTLQEICTVGILAMPTVEVSLLCLLQNIAGCGVTAGRHRFWRAEGPGDADH